MLKQPGKEPPYERDDADERVDREGGDVVVIGCDVYCTGAVGIKV